MTKKSNTKVTLTLDEAAQRYGFTVHYLRRQVEKGVLAACQQWLTTTSAVERFIGNNAQPTDGKDKEQTLRHLLASRLRILRGARGWSQEQMAEVSGLHRTYISLVERASCNISLDNIERCAHAFGVTAAELLGGDGVAEGRSVSASSKREAKKKRKWR